MLECSAERIVKGIHYIYEPIVRAPDFDDPSGWYVQVKIESRIFLIKGQGERRLILKEIGLGPSGISWRDIDKDLTLMEVIDHLKVIKSETV